MNEIVRLGLADIPYAICPACAAHWSDIKSDSDASLSPDCSEEPSDKPVTVSRNDHITAPVSKRSYLLLSCFVEFIMHYVHGILKLGIRQ